MKKISLFIIIDYVFKFILLFILNLIWCLYFIRVIPISIICAIASSILIIILAYLIDNKKHKRKLPSLKEEQHINDVKNTFIYMTNKQQIDFFYRLVLKKHTAVKCASCIKIQSSQQIVLIPYFKQASLTYDKLIELYNSVPLKTTKIIIVCNTYDTNITECIDNFAINTLVLNYKETYYELLKAYEFYPEITIKQKQKTKNSFKQVLLSAFNKKKTKGYVTSALFIIFASFFVSFKIYYLIVATILIIFAILCQHDFLFNKHKKEDLIWWWE